MKVENHTLEELAGKIIEFLQKENCATDVYLYYNNKRVSGDGKTVVENVNVKETVEYCNPDTITLTFEGRFYHEMNGYTESYRIYNEFAMLVEKYGYYFEFGYAWSLTLYQ